MKHTPKLKNHRLLPVAPPTKSNPTRTTSPAGDGLDRSLRAVNYLAVAQVYLQANPLLDKPLRPEHIRERLLGHWGTCPGINFIYTHLNRLIRNTDASVLLLTGPGHGAAANLANAYLEGMDWCGLALDPARNESAIGLEARISRDDARIQVWVVTVDEAALMAETAAECLSRLGAVPPSPSA